MILCLDVYVYVCTLCVICMYMNMCSLTPIFSDDDELALTGRQGRQQAGGDTYTLEIAFPAVKYVKHPHSFNDSNLHPISSIPHLSTSHCQSD